MRSALLLYALILGLPSFTSTVSAQEAPASANLMTLGPIDGESDQKSSVVTLRFDSKPSFAKPVVEAHGSFLQIVLPNTVVTKPGVFQEANSPYFRKFAPIQLDSDTAALRLFVTKEAENLAPAVTVDILENRVLIILDHEKAEKLSLQNFSGVPVSGGPSPDTVVKNTAVRSDIPDPISLISNDPKTVGAAAPTADKVPEVASTMSTDGAALKAGTPAVKEAAADAGQTSATPRWADTMETKIVAVTIFCALLLLVLIGLKSWRRVAAKNLPPGTDFSLKTLATHALGPKQKITLIQVGGEQILLGISPDSINFLTSLKSQSTEAPRMAIDPSLFQKTLTPSPQRPALSDSEPLQRPLASPRSDALSRQTLSRSSTRPSSAAATASAAGVEPGSSIRYGVGDDGIKNFKSSRASQKSESSDESLEDVTRLIRKKLKDLPKV